LACGGILLLDSGPYAALVLQKISLRHAPWGPPDAPLQTAFPLDLPPIILDVTPSFLGRPSSHFTMPSFLPSSVLAGDHLGQHFHYLLQFHGVAV
jgi:hypothetical protein